MTPFTTTTAEALAEIRPKFTLAYQTFGDPTHTPLLLVMGLGAQMLSWSEEFCMELASRQFWVIQFDNRDVGLSTKMEQAAMPRPWRLLSASVFGTPLAAPYLLRDMATDAVGLLDFLGIDRAHVVGASMGGMIAQEMAIHYPQRLFTLTSIMSTTGNRRLRQPSWKMRAYLLNRPPAEKQAYLTHTLAMWRILHGSQFAFDEDKMRQQLIRAYERMYYPIGTGRQLSAIVASGDRTAALKQVQIPTLVIHGDADPLVPVDGGHATAAAVPHAEKLIIPGMGHSLPEATWPTIIGAIATHAGHTVPDSVTH